MPLLFAALVGAPAHADLPASAAPRDRFALVVGSTRAGLGQRPLRWAGADAARVEQALLDVGGVDPRRITRLRDPTRDELLASFDAITASVGAAVAAGARPELIVYYSGHARTSGLDLGREQLAPRELEAWLEAVPASLRLVVLDACHAGGLDGIKGAEAAAPFAVTALRGEQTEGVAVLTSSTASELAQESDVLEGSYFTSHLVAGLRGAADADADQVVTLDELYRYTYDRTLISTSETAAGGQHPVLQTRLSGTGSVVMSRLGTSAAVTFAPQTEGRMLWARRDTARVEAEVDKPRGRALALGLPVGDYDVWVTSPRGRVTRCRHEVRAGDASGAFAPTGCRRVEAAGVAKGPGNRRPIESFALEGALGRRTSPQTPYTDRLEGFDFTRDDGLVADVSAVYTLRRGLAAVASYGVLEQMAFRRPEAEAVTAFRAPIQRLSVQARLQWPLLRGWAVPFVQAGGGPAWASTAYRDGDRDDRQIFASGHVIASGGLQVVPSFRGWRLVGLFVRADASYAPVLINELDERHKSRGLATHLGVRVGY